MKNMKCNYCDSADNKVLFGWMRYEKNNILQCNNCGLVFQEIRASKKEIEVFYKKEYRKIKTLPILTAEQHYNSKVSKKDAFDRTQFILRNIGLNGKKILEIGSASGGLLEKMRNADSEVEGIELNDDFRLHSQKLGFNIFNRPIEELNFKETYDIIVSFMTIEHFIDPKSAFKSIFSALKPNGLFLGEVPNQNDWRISIFNNEIIKRLHYDPNHYYYFSTETLKNYLETCGFSKIIFETIERYNSLIQLRYILCNRNSGKNIARELDKHIFPDSEKDDVRLPHSDDQVEHEFNRIFERAVNYELKGNCIRFVALKRILSTLEEEA